MTDEHRLDLTDLGFDDGARLLLRHALSMLRPGERVTVFGSEPANRVHLLAWCRAKGHRVEVPADAPLGMVGVIVKGAADDERWLGAVRAGSPLPGMVLDRPEARWGLAPRGALVEDSGPGRAAFDLDEREMVWADIAPQLYANAAAKQWDPAVAVDWSASFTLAPEIEDAVVQIMTYLVENEQAALVVPARFLGRIHPHYREVVQLLAVQVADEARHMEIFTRRALLKSDQLGRSGAGGRASLLTLLEESDYSLASFLLSVLGEGTFVDLLGFLVDHAPDPVTRQVAGLAQQDERRHVAFGVAHLAEQTKRDPSLHGRLRAAVERRHDVLVDTAGLNEDVFDSLVLLAAGSWANSDISRGYQRVQQLQQVMDQGRRRRLERLGFPADEAAMLSALHTRNFM